MANIMTKDVMFAADTQRTNSRFLIQSAPEGYNVNICMDISSIMDELQAQQFDSIHYRMIPGDIGVDVLFLMRKHQSDAKIYVYTSDEILKQYESSIRQADARPIHEVGKI